jgi:hypothetical protein
MSTNQTCKMSRRLVVRRGGRSYFGWLLTNDPLEVRARPKLRLPPLAIDPSLVFRGATGKAS